ncbi:unnamed protein product [Timema podura]|uniref:Uncharacterized protein n=1 Tax=Timema podura TaxID=61482 RepID=A0ABN7P2J2_TIMPD|nr:unnamed protein product [Timema podura]
MVCIRDELMLATTRGHILRYRWDGSENRDYCLDLRRVPFCIDQQVSKVCKRLVGRTQLSGSARSNLPMTYLGIVRSGWNTISTPGRTQSQRQPSPGLQQEVEEPPRRVYDEEIPPAKTFSCPKCEMVFRQLEPLEYHVETCLELTN